MPELNETGFTVTSDDDGLIALLRQQLEKLGAMAATGAKRGVVKTTRLTAPLMRGYTGCHTNIFDDISDNEDQTLSKEQLSDEEIALVQDASSKMTYEAIELATLAYPVVDGIPPYRAVKDDDGCYPPPHLGHLLSLGKAVRELMPDREQEEPAEADMSNKQAVLLTSLNANEYGYLSGPLEPKTIRRIALNEREVLLNQS